MTGSNWRFDFTSFGGRPQEGQQQAEDCLGLLLLHPMPGALQQVNPAHPGAGAFLHALDRAWPLVDTPVALARDEDRRHSDRAAGKQLQFALEGAAAARAVPVEPALEAVAPVFAGIDGKLAVGQPAA